MKLALLSVCRSAGPPRIVVSGGIASGGSAIVHSKTAGGSSTRPKTFVERTSKVWPSKVRFV